MLPQLVACAALFGSCASAVKVAARDDSPYLMVSSTRYGSADRDIGGSA